MEICVTGASGHLGYLIGRRLYESGIGQVLLVRDPARAPRFAGTDVRVGDFNDAATIRRALAGIDTVFMVSLPGSAERLAQHIAFVDAAVDANVRQLVYTSFLGASPAAAFTHGRLHWATEAYIRASGLQFTLLRNNLYADLLPSMVGADGIIRGPAGSGRVSAVVRDDVAEVAAAILRRPREHVGATYDVTGPEALTLHQVAKAISAATGRAVAYRPQTEPEAYASRTSYHAPRWQVEGWVSSYLAIAAGELQGVSDIIPKITGRRATTLAELIRTEMR
jgi:NAD(P)H dehydrogenase (quinone)